MEEHHGQGRAAAPQEPLTPWRAAGALAALALALPPLVMAAVVVDSLGPWRAQATAQAQRRAASVHASTLALTPSGRPPRQGAGSHPAVSRAHGPALSQPVEAP
jgi:hypothetical protein